MRVLLIEDDAAIAAGILDALRQAGFEAAHAATGAAGLEAVDGGDADLVLLDLGLPDVDGVEVCRRICTTTTLPVIVVSARGDEFDRVLALEMGADDYLVKPFGFRELAARIRAVTRRAAQGEAAANATSARTIGALTLDPRSRRVSLDGEPVHLTAKEFELLEYLTGDPGAVMRRSDILRDVWGTSWYGTTKTLDAHVAAIRKKLGDPRWIEAVRGVGFRFGEPG
ncbi:response regulator transcription factor [Agromyces bauzanensis]|uniref:Sensory transduction protein RegX3 n=1 Tax=Agromyces bauzanensis TaxID=1308924 RepID=A0A917UTV7_9MICO|nr:response regulator transcription factor [Agromyces bauzanensis]GGJ84854.1 DNA-binding response regulator [Agromyces bauzanensis]